MDRVITEIIIGAVILILLLSIIPIYKSSAELVSSAGETMDENENIKEVTFGRLPEAGDVVSGRYLLEFINYSAAKYQFEMYVKFLDMTYNIRNSTDIEDFSIIDGNMFFEVTEMQKEEDFIRIDFSCLYE